MRNATRAELLMVAKKKFRDGGHAFGWPAVNPA